MQCNHCHHRMYRTGEVIEANTRQTWFRCPVCDHEQTTSEPYRPLPARYAEDRSLPLTRD